MWWHLKYFRINSSRHNTNNNNRNICYCGFFRRSYYNSRSFMFDTFVMDVVCVLWENYFNHITSQRQHVIYEPKCIEFIQLNFNESDDVIIFKKNQNKCKLWSTEKNSKRQLESQKDVQNENKTLKHRTIHANRKVEHCVYVCGCSLSRKRATYAAVLCFSFKRSIWKSICQNSMATNFDAVYFNCSYWNTVNLNVKPFFPFIFVFDFFKCFDVFKNNYPIRKTHVFCILVGIHIHTLIHEIYFGTSVEYHFCNKIRYKLNFFKNVFSSHPNQLF